jgi:hypothetical protein
MVKPEKCRSFGLADGYRSAIITPQAPPGDGEVPQAIPITLSEVEKLKVSSCRPEEQEKMKQAG